MNHIYLAVGSRMIDRSFLKESGFGVVVLLQFGDRGDMLLLWDVLIVEVEIALQGGFQVIESPRLSWRPVSVSQAGMACPGSCR